MKTICNYKELSGQQSAPSVLSGIGNPIHEKKQVLHFLKKFEAEVVQARAMMDYIANDSLPRSVECYTDGEYVWTSEDIYHFEKYNIKLNDDFIQYVLNRPE